MTPLKAFIDLETTGLDHKMHAAWEISIILERGGVLEDEAQFRCMPFAFQQVDAKALEVGGITMEELMGFEKPEEAHAKIKALLNQYIDPYDKKDKAFFIGFNSTFDERFLRALFENCDDKYFGSYFWWPSIDVAVLAADALMLGRPQMRRFRLQDVAEYMGVPLEGGKLHDSMYDATITREIYRRLKGEEANG